MSKIRNPTPRKDRIWQVTAAVPLADRKTIEEACKLTLRGPGNFITHYGIEAARLIVAAHKESKQ